MADDEQDQGDRGQGFAYLGERTEWQGRIVSVVRADYVAPDGEGFEREVVRHPGAVAVVPVEDDGTVVLLRQFRAPVGAVVLEVPAGTCDVDEEPPEETARRELAEEVGLEADRLERLASVFNSPGFCDQVTVVFLATGLSPCATGRSGIEERWMSVERVALDDLADLVDQGELRDSTTVLGLALAQVALARRGRP